MVYSVLLFLSPSGCTFWGQRAWSTRRRWTIRVILWTVAPVVILLVSLLAFPVITVAIPVATGYEVHNMFEFVRSILSVFRCSCINEVTRQNYGRFCQR